MTEGRRQQKDDNRRTTAEGHCGRGPHGRVGRAAGTRAFVLDEDVALISATSGNAGLVRWRGAARQAHRAGAAGWTGDRSFVDSCPNYWPGPCGLPTLPTQTQRVPRPARSGWGRGNKADISWQHRTEKWDEPVQRRRGSVLFEKRQRHCICLPNKSKLFLLSFFWAERRKRSVSVITQ